MNDEMVLQTDNNQSLAEDSNQKEGTTTFISNDAVAIRDGPLSLENRFSASYFPNVVQSVIQYLNKPVPIASGAWSTGSTAGTLLYNQDSWVGVWGNTMYKEKLKGFYGLRATLKIDLVLNANPFQQGRLRLCYYPAAVLNRPKAAAHISHRIPLSQLPGIDIGCGDEMVSFSVPYVTPARFIELTSTIISWGDIYLAIMSPLNTGTSGATTADYTLWYSLQDVELFGQTNKAVSQQSVVGKRKVSVKVNPSEKELKPISHVLGSAADFAGSVAKIPILSPWAGPVSWFLNAAKGAALSFGFSKPTNSEQLCMMSSNYHFHTTTAEGVDNSAPLAVNYDSKLKLLDSVSEGGVDEMSIPFIASQWSFLTEYTLTTTDTLGASIYALLLQPDQFYVNAGTREFYFTPIMYLTYLYSMYRGGIEVMFKFIKTGFHAGSIAVSYVPGPNDATISLTDSSYVFRTIIDLQEGDQCCFRCPYLLPLDFIDVSVSMGRLYVNVVNPLRAPETVASSIKVLVYVRGADSLQFQKPAHYFSSSDPMVVIPQGGEVDKISSDIVCEAPGDGPTANLDYSFCQDSMSEVSTSVLQLLKRYNALQINILAASTVSLFEMSPWVLGAARYTAATFTQPPQAFDYIGSFILSAFAFMRGGVRIRTASTSTSTDTNTSYMYRVDNNWVSNTLYVSNLVNSATGPISWRYDTTVSLLQPPNSYYGPILPSRQNYGGNAVQIPFQGPYRMAATCYAYQTTSFVPFDWPRSRLSMFIGGSTDRLLTRAYADDFQALFWVGIPRMSTN